MEDTQAIDWDIEEEEETEQSCESLGCNLEPVGRLHIFSGAHGPEKDFPLHLGKNVIGRMPGCSVALPFPSISKQHAEIEISAWDKAPILRDCGSLNGTQILRPPKVLSPGVSHRLRDQELILFADLPCQYRRLDVPLPFVSRGSLTVEETPRAQGGTQPQRLLLAEDSEEEVDSLSERCVVKKSRITSSSMGMIVPESEEEGNSPVLGGPGPPFAFNLNNDTVAEDQQPATEEASSAARRGAAIEPEQSEAEVTTKIQLEKNQPSVKESDDDRKVKRGAGNGVVPAGVMLERRQPPAEDSDTDVDDDSRPPGRPAEVHLERVQPLGFIDSDTDIEEEGIPATPAVVPMKKRKIFHGVGIRGPGAPGLAHLQESQAGSDTDMEEGKAPQPVPLEKSQASMVINSDTDDEEEVSAALTLARLKESHLALWNRDAEEDMAQPVVLLQQSQTTTGRDSDTDVEEEELPVENREAVPKGHTKIRALVRAHSEKKQPSFRDSDKSVEADKSSPGIHLERSQASTTVDINTQVEESAMVSMQGTNQTDVEADTPGESTQRQGEGAQVPTGREREPHVGGTKDSKDNYDDSEDLDLQATQCFLERENQSLEGSLDESWEVLATQPFCLRESKDSETQPFDTHLEACGSCLSPPRAIPGDQHPESPVHTEPMGIQGREMQTMDKDTGLNCKMPPAEKASRIRAAKKASRGDQESPDACLPPTVPETSAPPLKLLNSQSQKCVAPQPLLSPFPLSIEPTIPKTRQNGNQEAPGTPLSSELEPFHPKPKIITRNSSRMTPFPATSAALEPHPSTSTAQPDTPKPTSQATRGRTNRSSVKTPETVVPTAPELQPSTSTEEPVTPEPMFQATRGRKNRFSVKNPETIVPTAPEPHPSTSTDQPVTPKPTSQATRGKTNRSSVKTPETVVPTAPELQPSTSTNQLVTLEPTSWATRGRTNRSSVKTPESTVPVAPELPPSTSTDQPVTPAPISRTTRGRTNKSSVKTPESVVSTAPELQPCTSTDQPVTPEPTSRTTRGRTNKSSVKTPESVVSTAPELQPCTSTDQPVTPEPTSRATRGRKNRSSVKTPETVVPIASELQASASTDQPVTPEPTSRTSRGRTNRSSVKTAESVVPTAPELQPSISTDQPVTPEPTSRTTRGRTNRSSVKTPESVVPIAPELQPSTSRNQLVTPEPTSRATRGRTNGSSVRTPEPVVPTAPEPLPTTSIDQPVTPKPTSRAIRGRVNRSSVKTPKPVEPAASNLEPLIPTDQPVTPEAIVQGSQSKTLRSSIVSAVSVPTTPEFQSPVTTDQPISPEPIPQASCSKRQRVIGNPGSLKAPIDHKPCSAPLEPKSQASRNQRWGAVREAESLTAIPEPASFQLLETPTHASQIQKVEAVGRSRFTPEPQPKASQSRKRPFATMDSPPLQKQPQREVSQKTVFLKEELEDTTERPGKEEDVMTPKPGKKKRHQAEEEPNRIQSRSLRRTKLTAPNVLFTGVVDAQGERAVLALGGSLAGSAAEASHLVTDRIRRTVKFLCALGRGIPILSLDWLHQSRKAGCFLPPDEYVVTDPEQEKNFGFSLQDALSRARERRLLEGYEIHVTPGVQPPPPQMGEIINCCGGTVLPSMPRSYKPQRVVITCPQDFPRCSVPRRVGLPLLSPEFLLTGVLKQEAKPEAFVLSPLKMSST
uniref:Mediator of DNA damage checkpoint protein 1 n=1 Tax=Aotus nancymaae TaxID=37293 RepID=A0A2K5D0P9_AOTNA